MFPHNLILLLQASEDMNLMFSMQASENMNSVLSFMLSLLGLIGSVIVIIGALQFIMSILRENSEFSFKGITYIALGSTMIVMKSIVNSFIINPDQDSLSDVSEEKINTSTVLNNVNANSNTISDDFWMILGVLVIVIIFAISMLFYVKYMKSKGKTKEKIEEDVLSTENIKEECDENSYKERHETEEDYKIYEQPSKSFSHKFAVGIFFIAIGFAGFFLVDLMRILFI